jgi:tRNA isopentenyl-2-thiomethyl-A-37 hydroxylase MiaE
MKATINEKRVVKGYKVKPSVYKKAIKAQLKKAPLATFIEQVVITLSEGGSVQLLDKPAVSKTKKTI